MRTDTLAPDPAVQPATRTAATGPQAASLNCLSIDVEEYFQCEVYAGCIPRDDWARMERRARPCLERIAGLLAESGSQATFFVLGWTVPYMGPVLRELAKLGHEIACHGDSHQHIARLTPDALREDLRQARRRLEDALGVSPQGYRAPTFSVTRKTAWAVDVIAEVGFTYDSSIFPIRHDRYGVPDAPAEPFMVQGPGGRRLLTFPPLTVGRGRWRIPVGGGGYLRLLPGAFVRHCVAAAEARREAVMLYVHPWELDPDQPKFKVSRLANWRHHVNQRTTERKLAALLRRFRFCTASAVLARYQQEHELTVFPV